MSHNAIRIAGASACALALALAACGSDSPQNWYANGRAYAVAFGKAQGDASLIGVTAQSYCLTNLNDFAAKGKNDVGISLGAPSLSDTKDVTQWVSGCVAGTIATGG